MVRVKVLKSFKRGSETVEVGTVLEVPVRILKAMEGYIAETADHALPKEKAFSCTTTRDDSQHSRYSLDPWPTAPRAWLEGNKLCLSGVVFDLASEIVKLTGDDLVLQRRLLEEHCQAYGPTHLWALIEAWEERAAIMEHDGGLDRQQAENEAAKIYHLTAWLQDFRATRH